MLNTDILTNVPPKVKQSLTFTDPPPPLVIIEKPPSTMVLDDLATILQGQVEYHMARRHGHILKAIYWLGQQFGLDLKSDIIQTELGPIPTQLLYRAAAVSGTCKQRAARLLDLGRRHPSSDFTAVELAALWIYLDFRCCYCHEQFEIETDHILPLAEGGSNKIENIQFLCQTHHRLKHRRFDFADQRPGLPNWMKPEDNHA